LDDHSSDTASPQLKGLRWRPSLATIVAATAKQFSISASALRRRSRADDASRAGAAHVARVRSGYAAFEVSTALGYRSHGVVAAALQRYEASRQRLARIARRVERYLAND
jgi:chromosomal replication initiation ATPase DnaA